MRKIILICIFIYFKPIYSQTYTQVNSVNVLQNNYYANNNAGYFSIANSINNFINAWRNNKKKERTLVKTKMQLDFVKNRFKEIKNFPTKITDGWHLVLVTDNFNYCKEAQVFIKDNKIKQFIINNYVENSINFKMISKIKKAKCLISLEITNENFENAEVYFVYDLDESLTIDRPLNAGYICIWSDIKKAKNIKLWIDKHSFGNISKRIKTEPTYYDKGTITIKLKPGTYDLRAEGRGSISWKKQIIIKENKGFIINLNKKNKL